MATEGTKSAIEQPSVGKDTSSSLLEDASTLLMFHSGAVSNKGPENAEEQEKQHLSAPEQTTPPANPPIISASKLTPPLDTASLHSHIPQHMSSPGPAIAALAGSTSPDGEKDKNQKAIVAAAALAAAAGVPLPLVSRDRNELITIDEHLRSSPAEVREAVKATADEISQDHINALKETAQAIRESADKQANELNDIVMKDNEDNDRQEDKNVKRGNRKGKRNSSPEEASFSKDYAVDPDLGIITCVCGSVEDDGFTIQCDNCNRWQHAVCMGIDPDYVPENYSCNVCQPRKVDVKRAKQLQADRIDLLKKSKDKNNNNNDNGNKDAIEERSNSNRDKDIKERSKPKPPNYGKNLEEADIEVPNSKDAHLALFYGLETYDYQDELVYNFVNNLLKSEDPTFREISTTEYEKLQKPKIKVKPYSDVNNKKFNGISKLGLFTEEALLEDDLIEEYLGEINFKERYISDSRNHYRIWGVEKPQVSFIPNTPLVIDARFSGNLARFARRSCNPNSELKVVKVTNSSVKFFLVAKKSIKPNTELTIGWNWDPNHSIRGIIDGATFDQTNDTDKPSLVLSVESILTFVECACTSNNECALSKVKKASAHIYRSTRKGNNTSGLKLLAKDTPHVPIQERLLHREFSNLRDSNDKITALPIISASSIKEAEIHIKPFIYSYLKNKRKLEFKEDKLDYLPIPLSLVLNDDKKDGNLEKLNNVKQVPKPVKKLSFADYKKKKKPN